MLLKRFGLDTRFLQCISGARRRGQASYFETVVFRNFANDAEGCRFACAGPALNTDDLIRCAEQSSDYGLAAFVVLQDFESAEISILYHGRKLPLAFQDTSDYIALHVNHQRRGVPVARRMGADVIHSNQFPLGSLLRKFLLYIANQNAAVPVFQRLLDNFVLLDHGVPFC